MAKNLVAARRGMVIFAALVAATAVAACGSSSGGASSSSSAGKAAASTPSANRSTLAACLKTHGVSLPARGPGGGGPPRGAPGGRVPAPRAVAGRPPGEAVDSSVAAEVTPSSGPLFRPAAAGGQRGQLPTPHSAPRS